MHTNEWLQYIKTQYVECDVKIFHPDFSTSILSHINVGMGFLLLFLLLIRWFWPLMRGHESLRNLCNHAHSLHLWTSFIVWLFTIQEGGSATDTGLNFALFIWHSKLIRNADQALDEQQKRIAYKRTMDDAVLLYGVNEAHCMDVITDERILRSIITMVATKLDHNGVNSADERQKEGNRLFDELLSRERLHRQLTNSPQINDTLLPWLTK